jgi:ketosteroid isomerase-like protein
VAESREHVEGLVRRLFETLSSGRLDDLAPFFDEETVWSVGRVGGAAGTKGGDAIINSFLRPVRTGLFEGNDPRVNITSLFVDGDWAIFEAEGEGKLKNHNDYANRYVFFVQVVGDKVRQVREYMDTAYAAKITEGIRRPDR